MPSKTKNYELIKPYEDEFYDVNDFNKNMDVIDEELKSINKNFNETENQIGYIKRGFETWSKDIYVDCNVGSDETGDGSQENPYKTINHAKSQISVIGGGHVRIFLSKGYFDERVTFDGYKNYNITIYGYGYGYHADPEINSTYRKYTVKDEEEHTSVKWIHVYRCSWVHIEGVKLLGERYYYMSYGNELVSQRPPYHSHNSKSYLRYCLLDCSDKIGDVGEMANELININNGDCFVENCKLKSALNQCVCAGQHGHVVLYDCTISTNAPYVGYAANGGSINVKGNYYNERNTTFSAPQDHHVAGRNEDLYWRSLPLINGFTGNIRYAKSKEGVVYVVIENITRTVNGSLADLVVTTLPQMFRANFDTVLPIISHTHGLYTGLLRVRTNGEIRFGSGSEHNYVANNMLVGNCSFKAKVE